MDLYNGSLDASRLPQSKYVIVLHSDLLSRVAHFGGPPFFRSGFKTPSKVQWPRCRPPVNAHIPMYAALSRSA